MLPAGWLEAGGYDDSPAQSDHNGDRHRGEGSGSPAEASEPELPEGAG